MKRDVPELWSGATTRPEIRGRRGVISAGKSFAVAAGMRIYARGGNAIDAGVAAVLAAAVTEFSHFGFGGECPVLVYDARLGRSYVISGLGPAPAAARPELFNAQGFIDTNGPRACTVPAVVDALCLVIERSGTLDLATVMEPAIELARGFPMYETLRRHLVGERSACEIYPSTADAYYPGGRLVEVGELFAQPDLCATLEELARVARGSADRVEGLHAARRVFHEGDIAATIAAAVQDAGGLLTREDLARYRGRVEEPLQATYRGFTVQKGGFWCQGPALLQTLQILEGLDLRAAGLLSAQAIHVAIESIKLAFDDRDAHYGDPAFSQIPLALLSVDYARDRRALVDLDAASMVHRPGLSGRMPRVAAMARPTGDTTAVSAADAQGNLFSAVPSSAWLLGGAFIARGTGVPMGNRMQSFVLDPTSPNVLAPGKRPRMTLSPSLVLKDARPFLAIGTPGGDTQDQQILNVLTNLIDFELSLQRAIEVPRYNSEHMQSSFGRHQDQPGVCTLEETIPDSVRCELASRGHIVRTVPALGMGTGMTAAGIDPSGTLRAGADPRGERYALGD